MIRFPTNQSHDCERAILENLGPLYGFAMSLAHNPADAEDLVQEACLRAIKGMPEDGIKSDPKVWLFTILRHVWINEWRRHANGPEFILFENSRGDFVPLQERLADQRACPEDYLERNAVLKKIREAISDLPEAFREVVVLRYFEGFSYREIASIVGCPAGTVMSRLSRARAELRNVLKEKQPLMVLPRKRGLG